MALFQVSGLGLDGSTITATFGKIEVRLISAQYGDKLEPGKLVAMGSQAIDEITPGTYDTDEVTLKLSSVQFRTRVLPFMPLFGGGNIRMPIVIGYQHPDMGFDSDLLEDCRLINWPASVENTNAAFTIELKAICRQVRWSTQRKTINNLFGVTPGLSGF